MGQLRYPVIYWPLGDDRVYGRVVGSAHEVVAKNTQKAAGLLKRELKRALKEHPWESDPAITDPELEVVSVELRPTYRDEGETFPVPSEVSMPVPAVFGPNDRNAYTCFLPLFRENFLLYNLDRLDQMVRYFTRTLFEDRSPREVYHHLLPDPPTLDTLRIQADTSHSRTQSPGGPDVDLLGRVADRHPPSRSVRRDIRRLSHPAWERGEEVRDVRRIVHEEQGNLLLTGRPGVGKTAVLRAAIQKIHGKSKAAGRSRTYFWKTTPNRMVSQAQYLGDWQEQCEQIAEELDETGGVLWIENFVSLLRVGGDGPEDSMGAYLESHVAQNNIQMIGEVRPQELETARRLLPGFVERFQTYRLEPTPRSAVLQVLGAFAEHVEDNLQIEVEHEALEATHRLLDRYEKYASFPGKAVRFLKRGLQDLRASDRDTVTEQFVIDQFVQKSGLPELLLRDDIALDAEMIREYFKGRIVGQDEAIERVADVVKVFKAGLNDPEKPIATLLFVGPTGVGKTETVRTLADFFFGAGQDSDPLIRLDMSEFQHPAQVRRLIGTGEDPGRLVREVREKPFSVLLLDEIEKAHSVFFDTLLTVLDEGLLFDTLGRATDFRNSIIVMTSNIGTQHGSSVGFSDSGSSTRLSDVRDYFRPEFFNRLDQVVPFHPLSPDAIREITRKELQALNERAGMREQDLQLTFSDALVEHISTEGFDAQYGARHLQRTIEQTVVGELANELLDRPDLEGSTLLVDYADGNLRFYHTS